MHDCVDCTTSWNYGNDFDCNEIGCVKGCIEIYKMDSDSNDESTELPSKEICEERSQQFASLTNTDTALAFSILQKSKWSLERALNSYYAELEGDSSIASTSKVFRGASGASNSTARQKDENKAEKQSISDVIDPQPHRIRIMSWNIDGLDTNNLLTRARAVCSTILREKPDVVFLQEVVPQTLEVIEDSCPTFQVIPGGHNGYFTAMMLSVNSVVYSDHDIKPFYSSMMSRNLLLCKAKVKGVDMQLMTSHLESTKEHDKERKKQLKTLLKEMCDSAAQNNVIAAGDFNLRDKEIEEIGGLPENVLDVWEVTGKRPEAKFTWDLMRNDNLEWNQKFKPRSRFDRMLLRYPAAVQTLKPRYFELVGIERIKSCRRFPSDHWGILAHFDKM